MSKSKFINDCRIYIEFTNEDGGEEREYCPPLSPPCHDRKTLFETCLVSNEKDQIQLEALAALFQATAASAYTCVRLVFSEDTKKYGTFHDSSFPKILERLEEVFAEIQRVVSEDKPKYREDYENILKTKYKVTNKM